MREEKLAAVEPRRTAFPEAFAHATLVLDWQSEPSKSDDSRNIVSNWANNSLFYDDVVELARCFPQSYFIIRGKNADWLDIEHFADIRSRMAALPNIAVNTEYDRFQVSHELAMAADSVIARYTSLGDQCLALGKPVVFHDGAANGGPLVGSILDFAPYPVMVKTRQELFDRYERIVTTGDVMSERERNAMVEHYYASPRSREGVRAEILATLETRSARHRRRLPCIKQMSSRWPDDRRSSE
jgi:hypothetical protein